ncbi:hypothetical protein J14TS2_09020 [Bacillus sp. J14TS2]|nr:hypothetical protein J14TS2_09020 [Bacillus sp. J14TS2]
MLGNDGKFCDMLSEAIYRRTVMQSMAELNIGHEYEVKTFLSGVKKKKPNYYGAYTLLL